MRLQTVCILAAAAVAGFAAAPASAGTSRAGATGAPLKECTRVNGRYGYYGNPWCSKEEQRRWDLWTDRRRLRVEK